MHFFLNILIHTEESGLIFLINNLLIIEVDNLEYDLYAKIIINKSVCYNTRRDTDEDGYVEALQEMQFSRCG